jgi:hypothetical protein
VTVGKNLNGPRLQPIWVLLDVGQQWLGVKRLGKAHFNQPFGGLPVARLGWSVAKHCNLLLHPHHIGQILSRGWATVFFANYVPDLTTHKGVVFMDKTVFTQATRARDYQTAQLSGNIAAHVSA